MKAVNKVRLTDEKIAPRLEDFRKITIEISKKMGYKVFD